MIKENHRFPVFFALLCFLILILPVSAQEDPGTLRTITKIGRLFDVSAVSIPANDFTEISARSYVDGILDREKAEALAAEQRRRQKQRIRILMEVQNGR